jgi:hypothetical protein
MVATLVIMGLIVVPLCTMMLQALTLPGVAGTRTQNASDRDNTQLLFAQDIAQATQITTYTAPTCFGFACNPGTGTTTSLATTSPTTTTTPISITCAGTPNVPSWSTIGTTWTDSSSGTVHSPTYKLVWYSIPGSAFLRVELHRVESVSNADTTLVRGYCKTGGSDVVATTQTAMATSAASSANPTYTLNATMTIALRDSPASSSPLTAYNFAASTRVQD